MKREMRLKAASLIITFLFVPKILSAQTADDWKNLKVAYSAYLKSSSTKNAIRVENLAAKITEKKKRAAPMPQNTKSQHEVTWHESPEQRAWGKTLDFMEANYDILKKRVEKGNRDSIRLVYSLRPISGAGELSENLDILLDSLIHSKPRLFLEELQECGQHMNGKGDIDELITFLGGEFADQAGQPTKEYQLRINDLQKVSKPHLKAIRDECIKTLRAEIAQEN